MNAEGWYLDPYGKHEHRWFSDGVATALVRDGGVEAQDAAPEEPIDDPLVPAPEGDAVAPELPIAEATAEESLTVFDGLDPADLSTVDGPPSAVGWFVDPYGKHEHRWFSDGNPTSLVRDDGVEADSPAPDEPFDGPLEPAPEPEAGAGDLLRADGGDPADQVFSPGAGGRAIFDTFGSSSIGSD